MKKLTTILLTGLICLLGATALAYNEAPMLRVKVAAGELPPVEERLPEEPSIVEPLEEIGQYGGTVHVFASNNLPWNDLGASPERGHSMLRLTEDGTIVPDLAKGYKLSDDAKTFTLYLRKGVKWSDGHPFTADDILFMYEDMHWNKKVQTWNGSPVKRIKKIDDYTVRFETDEPNPGMPLSMAGAGGADWFCFMPKHYLKKWHIKYNPKADELAKEEGYDHWYDCMYYHYWWVPQKDVNKPTLQPWIFKKYTTTAKVFERNPYYWRVDTAGNQLPYIDKIVSTIVDPEVEQLKVISGEADVAFEHLSLENYPLYKKNEEEGDYRVVLIPGIKGTETNFCTNQNEPDPALRKIYQDLRFRQALSLAINRKEINEVIYFGEAVPRQATIVPTASYYKEEWGEYYAQYDPDEANRLLDETGLTERNKEGFRIGPDGKSMLLILEYGVERQTPLLELVKEYWEAVGLKVLLKLQSLTLLWERDNSVDRFIIVGAGPGASSEVVDYTSGSEMCSPGVYAWAWQTWLDAEYNVRIGKNTLEDFEGGVLPGEEPPEEQKQHYGRIIQRGKTLFGSKEYRELSQKICDFYTKNLFVIGTVGMVPQPYIAKKNMGNIPTRYPPIEGCRLDVISGFADQLFFKQ